MMFINLVIHILFQNTNGVNFYNILTQESDEMKTSSDKAGDGFLGENLNMHCFFKISVCYINV